MIDPNAPPTIRFQRDDVPALPDVPLPDPVAEAKVKDDTAKSLERDMGFRPFDVEW